MTTAASATPIVASSSITLSVLGADDGGESNLTYTWATTGTPPATVGFSANNSNPAKSVTASFTKAGVYNFQVTITDANDLTVTSSVMYTVPATLTSIAVSPASVSVEHPGAAAVYRHRTGPIRQRAGYAAGHFMVGQRRRDDQRLGTLFANDDRRAIRCDRKQWRRQRDGERHRDRTRRQPSRTSVPPSARPSGERW